MKLPFEIIFNHARPILIKMAISHSLSYWDEYCALLNSYNWTDVDFNKELLKNVDLNWEVWN